MEIRKKHPGVLGFVMFCFVFNQQKITKVELDVLHAGDDRDLLERSKEVQAVFKEDYLSFMALNNNHSE